MKIRARSTRPSSRLRACGQRYYGNSSIRGCCGQRPTASLTPPRDGHRAQDSRHVEDEQHQSLQVEDASHRALRDEGADDQRVHRQTRRAGHQRRDHDRCQPIAPVGDGSRRHDAGDGAGKARQQRNERATREADGAHQAIEQEGCAWQVARIFQSKNEQEKDQDLRQEHQHTADASDDAVDQQAAQDALRHLRHEKLATGGNTVLDPFHRQAGPTEHRLEHQEQRARQNEHSP